MYLFHVFGEIMQIYRGVIYRTAENFAVFGAKKMMPATAAY